MGRNHIRLMRLLAAVVLAATVYAQADLPDLNQISASDAATSEATTAGRTADNTAAASTTGGRAAESTVESTGEETTAATSAESTSDREATTTGSFPGLTTTGPATATFSTATGSVFSLTGLPTIAGAGVPTLVIPFTANAPFMQKSTVPEGTVFIVVGAILAFMGACVLLWRILIAWSINRSVKRAALASIRGSEKNLAWGAGHNHKAAYYKEHDVGSSMSLDHLTAAGKTHKGGKGHDDGQRNSSAPPAGLFFSPTAQTANRASTYSADNRGSTYLPAGYYASPAAESPAGNRQSTTIGGSLAPYTPSRPTSNYYGAPPDSRNGLRRPSREGPRGPPSRDGYVNPRLSTSRDSSGLRAPSRDGYGGGRRTSNAHSRQGNSSPGASGAHGSAGDLPGTRAPSAVLDEMFENHGMGSRERF